MAESKPAAPDAQPPTPKHYCPGYADTGCIDEDCDRRAVGK